MVVNKQELKSELKKMPGTGVPLYVYDFLQTKECIELLLAALYGLGSHIPKQESFLIMIMLWYIGQENQELIKKLISFCAESFTLFM